MTPRRKRTSTPAKHTVRGPRPLHSEQLAVATGGETGTTIRFPDVLVTNYQHKG